MDVIWKGAFVLGIVCPCLVGSASLDASYLDLVHRNVHDFNSFDQFYRDVLRDFRHHRPTDTVSSPINVEKIRSNDFDEDYLKRSCYETASDLLLAHGYNTTNLSLSANDLETLLPGVLYSIENPGCKRQLPPTSLYEFFDVWIFGLICIVIIKAVHCIIFLVTGNHTLALTSEGLARSLSNQTPPTCTPMDEVRLSPVKYHIWLGLGFNAFTCGLILGTISYHLIPHIYETPNEDFSYTYLLRGTVILCGVFLFFIVEKLLRFRFKVDDKQLDESFHATDQEAMLSDTPMIQMARMHGTLHVHERDHVHHTPSDLPVESLSTAENHVVGNSSEHEQPASHNHEHKINKLILYHAVYDFSNDVIYGCGLSTALAHDRLIGFVLWILIFSEGFRRHSYLLSSLGRKLGFAFLFFSVVFLILGYVIGGILLGINQQFTSDSAFIPKEYIYSIVYGALFYTALVTLIPELNDYGQHLQTSAPLKEQRLLKILIFICQNLFLLIGILIALIFAIVWRYYHRRYIYAYISLRDSSRLFNRF
ncbi:unnamed protein product [Adineta ricciae]|uniref:Uncharacterized protein n=1 Tax=Adineta ricciae TaxID=249248 RepID=A0A814EVD6_ADIRI|nr:unnamed protein product [Adineta ricciae]